MWEHQGAVVPTFGHLFGIFASFENTDISILLGIGTCNELTLPSCVTGDYLDRRQGQSRAAH
jgi:hypothetical protein